MFKINIINYKTKDPTIVFLFAPAIFSKSSATSNIFVFENLFVCQMGLEKDNICWSKLFTFC